MNDMKDYMDWTRKKMKKMTKGWRKTARKIKNMF